MSVNNRPLLHDRICKFAGCTRYATGRRSDWCHRHYEYLRYTGKLERQFKLPLKEALMLRVEKEPYSGCWIWTGGYYVNGYGVFRNRRAHRLMYEVWIGPIPDGMNLCHKCDSPFCVNPQHMFVGTQTDNMLDCHNKGRHPGGTGVMGRGKFSEERVATIFARLAEGFTHSAIATELGISQASVSLIRNGVNHRRLRDKYMATVS